MTLHDSDQQITSNLLRYIMVSNLNKQQYIVYHAIMIDNPLVYEWIPPKYKRMNIIVRA